MLGRGGGNSGPGECGLARLGVGAGARAEAEGSGGSVLPPERGLPRDLAESGWWLCVVTSASDGMPLQEMSSISGVQQADTQLGDPPRDKLMLLVAGGVMAPVPYGGSWGCKAGAAGTDPHSLSCW